MPKLKRPATSALWLKIHLYLALLAGFLFAIIGLTGSLSVYHDELDALLNPHLTIAQPQGHYQSLDKMLAAVKAAHPQRLGSWTLELPQSPHDMLTAWYEKPQESYFDYYAPLRVSVNPYTAEVVDSRFWGSTLMTWLLDIHTQLRLDGLGWQCVGILGGLMMVSVISGLILWWPSVGGLRQALQFRYRQTVLRLLMDAHRWLGLLSAAALLVLAFTGIQLSFPQLLETITGADDMGHGNTGKPVFSTARPNSHPVPLEAAEFAARGPFPRATLRRVTTPLGEDGTYRINLRQSGEINHKHPFTMVWVDRWSGQIKAVRDPKQFGTGQQLMAWMWPLHTGEALGAAGRFAWFLAGLCPAYFYVSGLLHWLHKRGWVRDRQIDWQMVQERGWQGWQMLLRGWAWLLPRIEAGGQWLVLKIVQWRQARIKK